MPTAKTQPAKEVSSLDATFAEINKEFGAGTIVRGDQIKHTKRARIPTGSLVLDIALGGGWPVNSWQEIIGLESSGKSALVMKTIAANQERDKKWEAFWVASEDFDAAWAEQIGVDLKRVTIMNDNGMRTVYGTLIQVMASREFDAVVIDSYPALVPEEEEEAGMEDQQVGLGARVNGKFFRKGRPALSRSLINDDRPITCFMINQWRDKIGVIWGDPRTTPGGKNKNYEFVTRVELTRDEWITEGEKTKAEKVGITIKAHVKKNKSAAPEKVAVFDFYFAPNEQRIPVGSYDLVKETIAAGRLFGVVTMAGAFYRYGEQQWQGIGKISSALREDLGLQTQIREEVMAIVAQKASGLVTVEVPTRKLRRTAK